MQTASRCKLCRPAVQGRPEPLVDDPCNSTPAPQRASSDKKNRRRRLATRDGATHSVSRCSSGMPSIQTTADEAGARRRNPSKNVVRAGLGSTPWSALHRGVPGRRLLEDDLAVLDRLVLDLRRLRRLRRLGLGGRLDGRGRAAEHGAQVLPAHKGHGQGEEEHVGGVELELVEDVGDPGRAVEERQGDHGARGASRAHNGGDDGQVLRDHVRHDAVGGALRRVHEDRHDDDHEEGPRPAHLLVHAPEAEEEDRLAQERDEVHPEPAGHAPVDVGPVRGDAAEGAGEEVHGAEGHRQDAGVDQVDVEVVGKVHGQLVVHHELAAEAGAVLEDHEDHAVVPEALQVLPAVGLLRLPQGRDAELSCRHVLRAGVDPDSEDDEDQRRHGHGQPPRHGEREAEAVVEHPVDERHERLRETATQVAPAAGRRVRRADHVRREEDRVPELVHDEGGAEGRHEEADDDQTCAACDGRAAADDQGAPEQQHDVCVHRAHPLDDGAEDEAREDVEEDRGDVGLVDGLLALRPADALHVHLLDVQLDLRVVVTEADVLADDDHQRREGEPADERHHEGQRRGPEAAHMRVLLLATAAVRVGNPPADGLERLELDASVLGVRGDLELNLTRHLRLFATRAVRERGRGAGGARLPGAQTALEPS
mmetsp:Transcript_61984/g.134317  ORF Transcript_61984/g.134317 Transcript_61984/m.134317 type:complete len:652 (+) Transcript_61984:143-2098(+)